ncbi:MAG: serine/threonine protein kinase [Coriobacteriales bacterium]|jgi:serine/threonine protein kinase
MAQEGTVISGRYKILTQIGEGGMSRVYLALDTVLNKQWAAKEIKHVSDPVQRDLIVSSLITESNMIKSLDHPAIPRIVDIVDEDGTLYVIMDYIEGRTLAEILKMEGPQAEDDVVDWAVQLCDVLDYLHQRKPPIIFRDMKPSNVMLKPNGVVQLIDFGIAREYREDGSSVSAAIGDTVQLGTRGFAPPEQYGGEAQTDARSDVYSLGATMYCMLTGRNPGEPPYEMVPVRQVVPEISPGLERIVSKATQPNPEARYAGCAELAYDLEHYRIEDEAHKRALKRKWNTFVGTCSAAVACLALSFVFMGIGQAVLSNNYNHMMEVAEQSADATESSQAYVQAAAIEPTSIDPYLGLVDLYRSDGTFSVDEEKQLRESILPAISDFEHNDEWANLTFKIGKLYWYYYDSDSNGSEAAYESNRSERIRAASTWMHDACDVEGFEDHDLAKAYADISDFNTNIVPMINEGTDAGMYLPYYNSLTSLLNALPSSDNDVIKLETANLTLDAVRTYPRKFRADGVSEDNLISLIDRAVALANETSPTTDRLDAQLMRVNSNEAAARRAVAEAYEDVEVK